MADDKSKLGGQDRSRVPAEERYEVSYFGHKHGISSEEARGIIEEAGRSASTPMLLRSAAQGQTVGGSSHRLLLTVARSYPE